MNIKATEITEHFNFEKKSLNKNDINDDDNNKKIDSSEKEAKYKEVTKALTAFVEVAKKNNLIKYSIIRFPDVMLLTFAFTFSIVLTQNIIININWIYYLMIIILSILLAFVLAIYDKYILYKVIEKP